MIENKRLIYIGFAFRHHKGTNAGYHHIKDYLKYDKIIDCQWEHELLEYDNKSFLIKILRKFERVILGSGYTFTIIQCILLSIFRRHQVFHFIYAENIYKWLHFFKGKTNEIVCTYHQPVDIFKSNLHWTSDLKYIDKIILMSQKDIPQFNKISETNNIFFLPHGINTDFYSPDFKVARGSTILMVGNWLRDFEFANVIFESLLLNCPDLSVTIVTNENNFSFFKRNDRLHLLAGITDDHLKCLYRTSKCLFLPLKSFTANNALLEAAAMGCPIVIATNNIDTSYLNKDQIDFLPLHKKTVLSFLTGFINNDINLARAKRTHKYIEDNYSWEVIAKKTELILYK